MRLISKIILVAIFTLFLASCAPQEEEEQGPSDAELFESDSQVTGAVAGALYSCSNNVRPICNCYEDNLGVIHFNTYSLKTGTCTFSNTRPTLECVDTDSLGDYSCVSSTTLKRCYQDCGLNELCQKNGNTATCVSTNPCPNGVCDAGENYANCPLDCPAVCGNGMKEGTEECDDGNTINSDGCAACKLDVPSGCDGIPTTSTECCLPQDMEYIRTLSSASYICPEDQAAYARILACLDLTYLDMTFSDMVTRISSCSTTQPPLVTCLPDDMTFVIDQLRAGKQPTQIPMTEGQKTIFYNLVSKCPIPDISSNDPLFLNSIADCLDGQRCTQPPLSSNPCLPAELQDDVSTLCNPVDDTALTEDQQKLVELIISLGLHTGGLTCEQIQSTLSSLPVCLSSGNPGRMTGGGSFFLGGMRITHGFTLHCNVQNLPNRLEVNWAGTGSGKSAENNFHLQALTTAICLDDPQISPGSPSANFDTYEGRGTGLLNGVNGATAHWIFTDAGEPGKNDEVWLVIKNPSGTEILRVGGNWEGSEALSLVPGVAGSATDGADIKVGNQQAHP